ncbi:MAG TPA: Ig-like domain-containing protein [Acidobacteriaceae bacterium]|nr:Ig-like domain-containing protein [Acidobacteriaceae bacterium]
MSILRGKLSRRYSSILSRSVLTSIAVLLASTTLQTGCLSRSLTAITIQPGTGLTTVVPGVSAQFKCYGTYTESGHAPTTQDITSEVTWSSTIPAVATVSSAGVATGVAPGQTNIIATIQGEFGKLTSVSNIVVSAPASTGGGSGASSGAVTRIMTGVSVIPGSQTLTVTGQTAQLIAIGTYNTSPTSVDLTSQVTWKSSDSSIVTVNSAGMVTGVSTGAATVTAIATDTDGSVHTGTATVSINGGVTARELTAVNVTPGSQTIAASGQTAQLIAIGTYNTAPLTADLTSIAAWKSSDASVATVSSSGLVTAVGAGSATITAVATATDGSVLIGSATITVSAGGATTATRSLTTLTLIPTSQTVVTNGETAQFLAIGTYNTSPQTVDLTDQVSWVSSDVQVATINSSGLATSLGLGTTTITAKSTAADGSVVTASATLQDTAVSNPPALPTLTIYGAGVGTGTVTSSPGNISCSYTGPSYTQQSAGPGVGCTGTFPVGATVTLTAAPSAGSFGGWSSNCTPVTSTTCTITMGSSNETVGAIFNNP